jgi:hypothetical protein
VRRAFILLGAIAFLVGLAFLVARPSVPDPATTPYLGVRGGSRAKAAGLKVLYRRGATEKPVEPATSLAGGDLLRFVFKGEAPRYLELRVRDGSGPVETVFPPAGGGAAARVSPGDAVPAIFTVGPGPGRVLVTALFSDGPRPLGAAPDGDTETVSLSLLKE